MQDNCDPIPGAGDDAESNNVPEPAGISPKLGAEDEIPARPVNPTRYGDWEKNGRCIDF
ncbi:MAG: DUF1674 domain-containing protein [Methylohalobius sp.]